MNRNIFQYGFPVFLTVLTLFTSCVNQAEDEDTGAIYFDYMVWGDEETGLVTVKLQFRRHDRNGMALRLEKPAGVELDGQPLLPDSTKFNGVYYEMISLASEFGHRHSIAFTDNKGKKYTTSFDFPLMFLKTPTPSILARDHLDLEMEKGGNRGRIRVVLTDTSFYGSGIEKIDTAGDDHVFITREELSRLKNGPVYLEIFREEEVPLEEFTGAGGRLWLMYQLKREFMLQDSAR